MSDYFYYTCYAMDWILTHQLSSKNLSVGEKLAMTEEFKREVSLENERKKLEGNSKGGKTSKEVSLQLECDSNNNTKSRSETWTDSQIAQKAGVGTGSVARYNKIMNSGDEELKEQVKTGQVTVNIAKYDVVRKSDNEPKLYA